MLCPGSSWETEVRAIYDAYNPQSPNCRFQYVLYNKVDNPSLTQTSPQFALHSGLWQQATRDNPDPQQYVHRVLITYWLFLTFFAIVANVYFLMVSIFAP